MFDPIKVGSRSKAKALVVGMFKGQPLDTETKNLDTDGSIAAASKRSEATGKAGSIVQAYPTKGYDRVFILGLGDKATFDVSSFRNAGGSLGRALSAAEINSVEFALSGAMSKLPKKSKVTPFDVGAMLGEGLGLVSWSYDSLRGSATTVTKKSTLTLSGSHAKFEDGLRRGLGMAEGSNIARTLSQTPPNIATPMWIAGECKKIARKSGMKCTVFSGKKLEDEKLAGLINVGKASENKPCMIRMEYTPKIGKSKAPIVIVGKTISYDSGGLSIKISGGMVGMKRDKDGGCGAIGAMHIIANVIKPNRPVIALLMSAENSISDEAYRPDDVIEFRNGVTVEITNTDAEGRLVMADGLCWACEKENPEFVVDIATLTGGIVVALGSSYAGCWSNDDALFDKFNQAGQSSGERVWRMPLHPEYKALMKSPIADILNSAPIREAHPIQGAAFLEHFVEEGVKWAHVDIAGTHATKTTKGPFNPGPTGFGARLLAEVVERS
ncbi:MAG: leucyl aminopeptidase family protein [Phycisphaerales bacterium]|nr:leucyl aminopeptidase family protein [Phycisphaerales bacterium]